MKLNDDVNSIYSDEMSAFLLLTDLPVVLYFSKAILRA
jgi:hypothetical protein